MKERKGAFARLKAKIKPEHKRFVDLGLDISQEVRLILSTHTKIKTQKELAQILGKEESEISRWLSGLHNITLESIAKLSAALDSEIIMTESRAREKYDRKNITLPLADFTGPRPAGGAPTYRDGFDHNRNVQKLYSATTRSAQTVN